MKIDGTVQIDIIRKVGVMDDWNDKCGVDCPIDMVSGHDTGQIIAHIMLDEGDPVPITRRVNDIDADDGPHILLVAEIFHNLCPM